MDWIDPVRRAAFPLAAAATLTACSVAGPRASPLPAEGPTMEQIYRERTGEADRNRAREALPLRPAAEIRPGPVRETALRQIERRFSRLENPDLVMVVFPHLAQGKYPVPGYVTAFPMYESVEYLLPGEGDGPRRRESPTVPEVPAGAETTARASGAE